MATAIPQGLISRDSVLNDFALWPNQEVLRIETLSDKLVVAELQAIMEGYGYSWHKINQLLQAELDKEALEFTLEDGDVIFEWNNLCDEKRQWERKRTHSVQSVGFKRDCLINLKIIPFKAGLGIEGVKLVTTNTDKLNLSTKDLWVDFDKWETLTNNKSIDLTSDDDSLASEGTEESTYEDDESESESEED
ncbi:hypothetical protein LARI1_G004942 [Lachnellula arida]|uniref:Uncharacterized protein n=1 Tax=Lachnellula arida TaxID=1316785 RepID=A0A8T9BC24_9HELO|nr:hypothetical protein LARI1_G004942 [Lachnellula arida]